jgi:hypothetical protein
MIERNRAMSLKEKQLALSALLESIQKYGMIEAEYAENKLAIENMDQRNEEELEKQDVQRRTESNKFLEQIMQGMSPPNGGEQQQQQQAM